MVCLDDPGKAGAALFILSCYSDNLKLLKYIYFWISLLENKVFRGQQPFSGLVIHLAMARESFLTIHTGNGEFIDVYR